MPSPRRFPAPWSVEVQPNYCVVRDADGQQIAYVYYSNDAGIGAGDLSVGFKFLASAEYRVSPRSPQRKENDPS
jgi:hypothetical protein